MSVWEVAGAVVSPKSIAWNSYNPVGIKSAVFALSSGCTSTCQYPDLNSKIENYEMLTFISRDTSHRLFV